MEAVKNVPKLRFPEYREKWSRVKIEDLFEFKNGLNKEKEYFGKGTPIINFKDVYHLNLIEKADINGLVELSEIEKQRYSAKKGDVFFTRTSETIHDIGLSATLVEEIDDCVFSGFTLRARPKDRCFLPEFTGYLFSIDSIRKEITTKSSMTTRALTSGTLLNKVKFYYPKVKSEQQKIANFLSSVDKYLYQLKEKKDLLEQYKKGMMQQLFSQQIRFKDENGEEFPEWEEKKAKKIFTNHTNKKHNGKLPILSASQQHGMVYRDENGIKIQASEKSVLSYKVVDSGDFVISLRAFQGGIDYSELNGICSPAYTVLKNIIPIDKEFYKFYFKKERFIERLSKTTIGIRDGKQITFDAFGSLAIPYPSVSEQQKIANFLSAIDKKIDQVNTQIETSEQYKKGLLQQLFV